jgi:hypothetical protein
MNEKVIEHLKKGTDAPTGEGDEKRESVLTEVNLRRRISEIIGELESLGVPERGLRRLRPFGK